MSGLIAQAPRRLISRVPGVTLVEHTDAHVCCGAAGTYTILQPEFSHALRTKKLATLEKEVEYKDQRVNLPHGGDDHERG